VEAPGWKKCFLSLIPSQLKKDLLATPVAAERSAVPHLPAPREMVADGIKFLQQI